MEQPPFQPALNAPLVFCVLALLLTGAAVGALFVVPVYAPYGLTTYEMNGFPKFVFLPVCVAVAAIFVRRRTPLLAAATVAYLASAVVAAATIGIFFAPAFLALLFATLLALAASPDRARDLEGAGEHP